jgi:hypothetical protein
MKPFFRYSAAIGCTFLVFLSACASPRVAYKKGFDFSQIHTVSIGDFSSAAGYPNSGAVVAGEFIRQMLSQGYQITTTSAGNADAIVYGSVTEFFPNRRYLIQNQQGTASQQTIVIQEPVELSGSNVYSLGNAMGLGQGNQIVVSNASVGVSAYIKDVRTGEIIWSNAYTYEGLDLNSALEGTVRYMLRSIPAGRK